MSPENAAIYSKVMGYPADPPADYGLPINGAELGAMLDAARAEGRDFGLRNTPAIMSGDRRVGAIFSESAPEVAHRCAAGIGLEVAIKGHDFEFGVYPIPARPAPTSIEPIVEELLDRKLGSLGDRVRLLEFESVEAKMAAGKMSINDGRRRLGLVDGEEAAPREVEDDFEAGWRKANPPTTAGSRLAAALFAGQGHPSRLPYVDAEDLEDVTLDGHFNLEAAATAFLEAEGRKHTITLKTDMSGVLEGLEGRRAGLAARPAPCDLCGKPGQFRAGMTFATCGEHGDEFKAAFAKKGIDPAGWKLVKDGPAEGLTVRATMKFDGPGDAERRERELFDSVLRHPTVTVEHENGRRGRRPWDRFYSHWLPLNSIGPGAPRSRR